MDPELANLNLDPPTQPSALRRGLVPALLVNAVFFVALGLSLQWNRDSPGDTLAARGGPAADTRPAGDAAADTRTMGGAPAIAPAAPGERSVTPQPVQQPVQPAPSSQAAPAPQPARTAQGSQANPDAAVPAPVGVTPQAPARKQTAPPAERRSEARPAASGSRVARENTRQVVARSDLRPSFDCAKARSRSERLICSDEELAALDRDTGRLHARARAAARDPAAFRRQNDAEWKQREATCRDKPCLLAWYSRRRSQLQQVVSKSR